MHGAVVTTTNSVLTAPYYYRWIVLALACVILFGNFYAYDLPASISVPLQHHFQYDDPTWSYLLQTLYSVYSVPNLVLPLVAGHLTDRFGTRTALIVCGAFVCIGQVIVCLGTQFRSFLATVLGRLVFGIGGESLSVAQTRITTKWFRGKEVGLAMGVNLSIARLGSVANDVISPWIAVSSHSVVAAMWLGFATCIISLASALLLVGLDRHRDISERKRKGSRTEFPETEIGMTLLQSDMRDSKGTVETPNKLEEESRGFLSPSPHRRYRHDTGYRPLIDEETIDRDPDEGIVSIGEELESLTAEVQSHPISRLDRPVQYKLTSRSRWSKFRDSVKDVFDFPPAFYVVCAIMVLLYGTVVPFNTIHSVLLQTKWYPGDPETAAQIMAIPDTISAILVPFCGTYVDRKGHRTQILLLCSVLIMGVHGVLGFCTAETLSSPVLPLVVLGLSYAMLLTFWPCIPILVKEERLARAFGFATVCLNGSLTFFPMVVAQLQASDPSFFNVEMFFVGCSFLGAVACLILRSMDANKALELPEKVAAAVIVEGRS